MTTALGIPLSPRSRAGTSQTATGATPAPVEPGTDDDGLSAFLSVRSRLFGIAYRMLGSAAEAEDIVQDVWVRWQTTDRRVVRDTAAFLATTTTRLAINVIQSARARRETYVGPWLPEPVDTCAFDRATPAAQCFHRCRRASRCFHPHPIRIPFSHRRELTDSAGGSTVCPLCHKTRSCPVTVHTCKQSEWFGNGKRPAMTKQSIVSTLFYLAAATLSAQQAVVTPLMSKDLLESPGKEVSMITVEYAPGGSDPIHRHNAHGLIYVLEGMIVMQVEGGRQVTLKAGDTFYEGPDDVHVVGRNASTTDKASSWCSSSRTRAHRS